MTAPTIPAMIPARSIHRTKPAPKLAVLFLAALFAIVAAPTALGDSYTTNIINGVSTNAGGGYTLGNSGPFNVLIITNGGVLLDNTGIIGNQASADNNSAIIGGSGSLWTNTSYLRVGYYGSSNNLTIANGGRLAVNINGYLGYQTNSIGNSILVTDAGSMWLNNTAVYVGLSGAGNNLTIANGGKVVSYSGTIGMFVPASNNSVLITDAGSVWDISRTLWIGFDGSGNGLIVSNGASIRDADATIGHWSSSNNSVLITGAGSVWSNSATLAVGEAGSNSSLIVTDGGQVFSGTSWVGLNSSSSNSSVVITGSGSAWFNSGSSWIGGRGTSNHLTVADGGTVIISALNIGDESMSNGGLVAIANGNLFTTNATSTGILNVRDGVLALNSGTVVVNQLYLSNTAKSVMTFAAGLLRSGGTTVSNGTAFVVGDGVQSATFDLNGGAHSFANGLLLSSNAVLIGNGTIFGAATNFGGISPGHSAGLLAFGGDLTLMDSSVLTMEVGGPTTNDYDRIVVNGFLRIGGLLNVVFTNGYAPSPGDVFDLFSYGTNSGSFSQTNLPTFQYAGTDWDTSHLLAPSSDPLSGSLIFIPEPSSSGLLLASAGVIWRRQRRPGTARKQPPCSIRGQQKTLAAH